jgi:hypothetical protein
MCPADQNPTYRQVQLPLPKKTLWEKLPESARNRCRQALLQMLQRVVLNVAQERSHNERED